MKAFLAGCVIGGGIGVLCAPTSGRETREHLRRRWRGLSNRLMRQAPFQVRAAIYEAEEMVERAAHVAAEALEGLAVTAVPGETGAGPRRDREHLGSRRDPEERPARSAEETRDKMLDKTLADSFPTSDPPSSIPDPSADDSLVA